MKYLTPFVFKAAICDNLIVTVENRKVIFRYREE
ncbi:transposase [Thermodesulfobacteriota bacterium]